MAPGPLDVTGQLVPSIEKSPREPEIDGTLVSRNNARWHDLIPGVWPRRGSFSHWVGEARNGLGNHYQATGRK